MNSTNVSFKPLNYTINFRAKSVESDEQIKTCNEALIRSQIRAVIQESNKRKNRWINGRHDNSAEMIAVNKSTHTCNALILAWLFDSGFDAFCHTQTHATNDIELRSQHSHIFHSLVFCIVII